MSCSDKDGLNSEELMSSGVRQLRKCAETAELSPDFRMVYSHGHGVLACKAGRFPIRGNYTTTIQRPTVLLGVFLCGFRTPRRLPGRSACANRAGHGRRDPPSSPLFCPIFSRNLRQLLRRGTRRRRSSSMACACADGNGWLAGLLLHIARANPRGQPQRQPLGGNGS